MTRWILLSLLAAVGLALFAVAGTPTRACEGELEWESVPQVGIIFVRYKECHDTETAFPTPLIRQTLRLRVRDGVPSSEYAISIEGRTIGILRTDEEGEGEWTLIRSGLIPGPDGRPRPNQRVDAGDLCMIHVLDEEHEAVFERI